MSEAETLQAVFLNAFDELNEEEIIDSLLDADAGVPIHSGAFSQKEIMLLEAVRTAFLVVRQTLGQDDAVDLLFRALCTRSRNGTLAINLDDPSEYRSVWHSRQQSSR